LSAIFQLRTTRVWILEAALISIVSGFLTDATDVADRSSFERNDLKPVGTYF
jgi:hypothetical protein